MSVVNIFLTSSEVENYAPFESEEDKFVFSRLDSDGPRELLEGPIWAFVDWVLDDLAGLEMCRRLRADPKTAAAHITMVLDEDSIDSRKRALEAGADDYMIGPPDRHEVLDRVLALRAGTTPRHWVDKFSHGELEIDYSALRAYWAGTGIDLMPNEFRLLRFLAENRNQVLSREEIIAGLGKDAMPIDERTVDVWVRRLRSAIREAGGGNPLRTVRAVGYVFDLR